MQTQDNLPCDVGERPPHILCYVVSRQLRHLLHKCKLLASLTLQDAHLYLFMLDGGMDQHARNLGILFLPTNSISL